MEGVLDCCVDGRSVPASQQGEICDWSLVVTVSVRTPPGAGGGPVSASDILLSRALAATRTVAV